MGKYQNQTKVEFILSHIECPRCGEEYLEVIVYDGMDFRCSKCGHADVLGSFPSEEYAVLILTVSKIDDGELIYSIEEDF